MLSRLVYAVIGCATNSTIGCCATNYILLLFLMNETQKRGPKLKGDSKRRGTNIAMSDETKKELSFIQEKLNGVSRSEAVARVIAKTASVLGFDEKQVDSVGEADS